MTVLERRCPSCGKTDHERDHNFCPICGTKLEVNDLVQRVQNEDVIWNVYNIRETDEVLLGSHHGSLADALLLYGQNSDYGQVNVRGTTVDQRKAPSLNRNMLVRVEINKHTLPADVVEGILAKDSRFARLAKSSDSQRLEILA